MCVPIFFSRPDRLHAILRLNNHFEKTKIRFWSLTFRQFEYRFSYIYIRTRVYKYTVDHIWIVYFSMIFCCNFVVLAFFFCHLCFLLTFLCISFVSSCHSLFPFVSTKWKYAHRDSQKSEQITGRKKNGNSTNKD